MPLYTRTGDGGDTGLFGNRRVPKDHERIEAYGTVDELNCFVGLLRSETQDRELDRAAEHIQNVLFEIGADLATEGGQACIPAVEALIGEAEGWIDASEQELPPLQTFVLPAGHPDSARLHVLRAIARRAERRYWTLARTAPDVPPVIGVCLNRLSDLFFSWARRANVRNGRPDEPWQRIL